MERLFVYSVGGLLLTVVMGIVLGAVAVLWILAWVLSYIYHRIMRQIELRRSRKNLEEDRKNESIMSVSNRR